jgi:hypothetical protein
MANEGIASVEQASITVDTVGLGTQPSLSTHEQSVNYHVDGMTLI